MRYSQLRRLAPRGAVNAVPLNCSAYSPWATRCGELQQLAVLSNLLDQSQPDALGHGQVGQDFFHGYAEQGRHE